MSAGSKFVEDGIPVSQLEPAVEELVLALGGVHEQRNLQWAHLRCNVSKGARMPESKVAG